MSPAATVYGLANCIKFVASHVGTSKKILIFIHGFKNTFEDSVRRAVGMAYDYDFDGPIMVWSWPSDGWATSYLFDEDSTKWTTPHFIDFMEALDKNSKGVHFNFLSHSMGARILLSALEKMRHDGISVDTITFAAPDEARDIFKQTILAAGRFAKIQTLYGSENDRALEASRYAHSPHGVRIPRAGDGGKSILVLKSVESVDTSELPPGDFWRHSYVFDSPKVVEDVKELVDEDHTASERGLPKRNIQNKTYWAIVP